MKWKERSQPCGLSVCWEAEDTPVSSLQKADTIRFSLKERQQFLFFLQFYQVNGALGRNNGYCHVTRKLESLRPLSFVGLVCHQAG